MSDEDINKAHIGGVIVSVLVLSAIDRFTFNPKIVKLVYAASLLNTQYLRTKNKDWLSQNHDNVCTE